VTSLTSSAPSSSARRATSAFAVSIETALARDRLEHGHDAPQLLVERHPVRARPRRLAADVDDRGPLVDHAARCGHRVVGTLVPRPPSENESGVTFTTPITDGRLKRASIGGRVAMWARV
jgi:hypothetical protein